MANWSPAFKNTDVARFTTSGSGVVGGNGRDVGKLLGLIVVVDSTTPVGSPPLTT